MSRRVDESIIPALYPALRESSKNMFRIGLFTPILKLIHPDDDTPAPAWKRFVAGTMTGALAGDTSVLFTRNTTHTHVHSFNQSANQPVSQLISQSVS